MDAGQLIYRIMADRAALDRTLNDAERSGKKAGGDTGAAFGREFGRALTSPISRAFSDARGSVRSGASSLASVVQGVFQGIGSSITGILVNSIQAGVGAVGALSRKVVQVGGDAENLQIAFRAIIGDAQRADKLLTDLRQFSAATPFTGTQVQSASQKLLTVVSPDEIVNTLRRIGEVASGTKSDLSELTTIYQQVLSKGKFQAEEMLQFAERGIPIQKALAEVLGVQVSEVAKLGSEGKIAGEAVVAAFKRMADAGGQFNGIMEKQSRTVTGLASTMQDGFEASLKTVYDKLNPALLAVLGSINSASSAASKNSDALDLVGRAAANVEKFLKRHQPAIDAATSALSKMVTGAMSEAIKAAEGIYGWLQRNPEVLEAMGASMRTFGNGVQLAWDLTKQLAPAFGGLLKVLSEVTKVFNAIVDRIQAAVRLTLQLVDASNLLKDPTSEGTSGSAVNGGKFTVLNPNGSPARSFATSTIHHNMSGRYGTNEEGQRTTSRGVAKDFTLFQNGRKDVSVPSPVNGVIDKILKGGGYGNGVVIRTPDGSEVLLGHFASVAVKQGQKVVRGQGLGVQGNSGHSTGTHVHIEAKKAILDEYYKSLSTGDWGVAARQLVSTKNSPANIQGFLAAIAEGESNGGRDTSVSSAGARGIYQFIPSTRSAILNKYGTDAWSASPQIQQSAAVNLIKDVSPAAYNAIIRGDFQTAARLLNRTWTSLPGGAEESRKWRQYNLNQYLPGGDRFPKAEGGGDPSTVKTRAQAIKEGLLLPDTPKKPEKDKVPQAFKRKPVDDFEARFRQEYHRENIHEKTPDDLYTEALAEARKRAAEESKKAQEDALRKAEEAERDEKEAERRRRETLTVLKKPASSQGVYSEAEFRRAFVQQGYERSADEKYWEEYSEWVQQSIANSKEKGDRIKAAIVELREKESAEIEARVEDARLNREKGRTIQEAIASNRQSRYDRQDAAFEATTNVFSSNLTLAQARAGRERDPDKRRGQQISAGQDQVRLELAQQLQQIEQLGRSGAYTAEQLDTMRVNAEGVAQVRIDELNEQFLTLGDTIKNTVGQSLGTFLQDVLSGTKSINEAFSDMLRNIAASVLQMGINRLIGGLFGGGVTAFAGGSYGGRTFATVGEAMKYERSTSGRRPMLAVINDGEVVLSAPQVQALRANANTVTSFASGFRGNLGGTSVNIGDVVLGDTSVSPGSEEKLRRMIKGAIYGVIQKEQGQGGILRR